MVTRQSSLEAIRERYQRSRIPIQQQPQQPQPQPQPSTSTSLVSTVFEEEEEDEDEDEEEEDEYEEDDDYSMYSSSSSIPDENINFDLVYALHTFVATVDGQASVVKGDAMTLLDDSNSYWWLVRALKTAEVGYIPAENIETPFERLARLNKHRNIEVTSLDKLQFYNNNTIPTTKKLKKQVQLSKNLACQLQIIITDDDNQSFYEEDFEEFDEKMILDDSDSESESESQAIQSIKNKYAPIFNPDFQSKPIPPEPPVHQMHVDYQQEAVVDQQNIVPEQPTTEVVQQQSVVSGLKRLLSIGKKNKPAETSSAEDTQYHVLRIFAGNINVGALFSTVAVTPDMNADQLLKLALQKFHIPLLDNSNNKSNDGIEYYLTVKSMDSDEITLTPQDKPLVIFESLSDHLTTPMPSLTYIKRLSLEQPTIKVTRVGVSKARQRAKARFGEDSVIRFSLHKRIKRTIETNGQIYVKISYFAENKKHHHHLVNMERANNSTKISTMGLIRKSSLLRVDQHVQQQQQQLLQQKAKQERIDKLVAVSTDIQMTNLTTVALEKFHMGNEDPSLYYITISINGKETMLNPNRTMADVLNDPNIISKGTTEKLFVLRKKQGESSTGSVLRRLDEAIQLIENHKKQLQEPIMRNPPTRSNSLSAMSRSQQKYKFDAKKIPTRSSSLKITGDVFDTSSDSSLSNLDDLQLELSRIVAAHSSNTA